MMKRNMSMLITIFLLLLIANTALAEVQSWYTYWGLGYSSLRYPDELQEVFDALADIPDVTHLSVNFDLLGFYFRIIDDNTIVGGILNASGDRYEEDVDNWMQVNQYTIGPSVMRFFGREVGHGPFVRGDVGAAWLVIDSDDETESSDMGLGVLVGSGYGIAITEGTRILLSINYAMRMVEDENYGALNISIGGLF